jgi:hypothetical protein
MLIIHPEILSALSYLYRYDHAINSLYRGYDMAYPLLKIDAEDNE